MTLHRSLLASFVLIAALAAPAAAQQPQIVGDGHGIGLGIEQNLGGLSGATFSYDAGRFRIDALLGLAHYIVTGPDTTDFGLAGRFFFKVHELPGADFSVGGGIGVEQISAGGDDWTLLQVELAAQLRVFVVPNVALSGSLGVIILSNGNNADISGGPIAGPNHADTVWGIGGQLLAGFGAIYYFR